MKLLTTDLQAGVIFGGVTIFAIIMWFVTPEDKWLRPETVHQALRAGDQSPGEVDTDAKVASS